MIKSFCIKTNNEPIIEYLLNEAEKINLPCMYISINNFKIYQNIIIHYTGKKTNIFISKLSKIISRCIINFYEKKYIKKTLFLNYFYFSDAEQKNILNNSEFHDSYNNFCKNKALYLSVKNYIATNKSMILDGFLNFRIKEYLSYLSSIVDYSVNNYLIEKEYQEFINLLQLYVSSNRSLYSIIHLVYLENSTILLDENLNQIDYKKSFHNTTYLSDISFSDNDYVLNALLELLPKKIFMHIIYKEDDFTNTVKQIFDGKIKICKDCNICNLYKSRIKQY